MLILTRRIGESLMIGDDVNVTIRENINGILAEREGFEPSMGFQPILP